MKKELMKNTIIIAIGKFSTQVISYLLLPLYTSILTTSEYGIYDFLVTACIFIVPFITLLMEESMFRFLIDEDTDTGKKKVMSNACIYSILSMIVWCIILFIILSILKYKYTLVFVLYIISCIFITLTNSITRGMGKLKLYSLSNFILSMLTIVLNILLIAVIKLGVNGLLYATIIANVITSLFIFFKLKIYSYIRLKYVNKKKLKEMITYSYPLVPNSIGWSIINISDRIIITLFLGSSSNGIYAMANKFPNIMNTFSSFFFTAFKENASKVIKKKDYEDYYNNILNIVHNSFIAISLLLITIIPFVFNIFINKSFNEAYMYIPILVIALYYGNMSGFYGSLFVAFKETKLIGKSTVIGAVINIVINLALIKFIGIYAAVISTLLSNYVVNAYRKYKSKEYLTLEKIDNYYLSIFMMILVTVLYYFKNTYINILALVIALLYSFISNKELINSTKNLVKEKLHK
ncbi:MAG: hypothetical protein E7157_03505 [Lactobacillales bacterium]|nr:hypothetical protein [Lactobacillales bacterium]